MLLRYFHPKRVKVSAVRSVTTTSEQQVSHLKETLANRFNAKQCHPREEMTKQYPQTAANVQEHYLFSEQSMQRLPWEMMVDPSNRVLWSFIQFREHHQLGNTQGYVHGGLLSAVFDGALGSLFTMSGVSGFTANLNIDYRHPVSIPSTLMLRAEITKIEGRKLWISGQLTELQLHEPGDTNGGSKSVVFVEGTGLFIEQKESV